MDAVSAIVVVIFFLVHRYVLFCPGIYCDSDARVSFLDSYVFITVFIVFTRQFLHTIF